MDWNAIGNKIVTHLVQEVRLDRVCLAVLTDTGLPTKCMVLFITNFENQIQ